MEKTPLEEDCRADPASITLAEEFDELPDPAVDVTETQSLSAMAVSNSGEVFSPEQLAWLERWIAPRANNTPGPTATIHPNTSTSAITISSALSTPSSDSTPIPSSNSVPNLPNGSAGLTSATSGKRTSS